MEDKLEHLQSTEEKQNVSRNIMYYVNVTVFNIMFHYVNMTRCEE